MEPVEILELVEAKKEQYKLENYMQSIAVINGIGKSFNKNFNFIELFKEEKKELTQEEADDIRAELLGK